VTARLGVIVISICLHDHSGLASSYARKFQLDSAGTRPNTGVWMVEETLVTMRRFCWHSRSCLGAGTTYPGCGPCSWPDPARLKEVTVLSDAIGAAGLALVLLSSAYASFGLF
jgi:hypothetical protein